MDTLQLENNEIFKKSISVGFSYLVLGCAFGAVFNSKGGSLFETLIIALFCFAGAAQFAAISFYKGEFNHILMFLTIVAINIRHIFYGFVSIGMLKPGFGRIYILMALTDENFAMREIYKGIKVSNREWLKIFGLNHLYWIIGCVCGSFLSSTSESFIDLAEFSLVCFFVSLFTASSKKLWKKHESN
jgi:4-azaleucine resistance transporter AzlC